MNRKSKSSGRRRSRSLVGFASKDLCETIPKTLDPTERLSMLLDRSFQYALSTVQKEVLPNDFDISKFRQAGTEIWEKIKNSIQEKNLVHLAVAENGVSSNSFSNENIEEYNKTLKILETESNKWKEELSSYRKSFKNRIDSPYTVNVSIWKNKEQLPDYSDIMQSTFSIQDDLVKQITCLSKYKTAYRDCLQLSKDVNKTFLRKCQNSCKANKPDTPRTVIRRMMDSRRNLTPYSCVKKKEERTVSKIQNAGDILNINIRKENVV